MSRSGGAGRRSGNPGTRAAATAPKASDRTRARAVATVLIAVVGVGAAAVVGLRSGDTIDERAQAHARAACDLTVKAQEATSVDDPSRLAAASLLLDRALLESEQAARRDAEFTSLDEAMVAVHAAAHAGQQTPFDKSIDAALATCQELVG